MKRYTVVTHLLFLLIIISCTAQKRGDVDLQPPDKRPVYHTQVADANETDLLKQQLGIEIKNSIRNELWFYSADENIAQKMTAMGYKVDKPDITTVYFKVVEIDPPKEDDIRKYRLQLINREKDHYLVRGSLDQLSKWKADGHKLFTPASEPRPREIEVSVGSQPDVQRIYDWGVDIFSAVKDSTGNYKVRGSAFDFQIDSIKTMKYNVTVIKSRI